LRSGRDVATRSAPPAGEIDRPRRFRRELGAPGALELTNPKLVWQGGTES
jgi:hypothetical protein